MGTDNVPVGDPNWGSSIVTGVYELGTAGIELKNYPNPFTDYTTLQFNIEQSSEVTIDIYDIMGRSVSKLNVGTFNPGLNNVIIHKGNMSKGIYILKMEAGSQYGTKKIVIK